MTNLCIETWYLKRKKIEKEKFRVCYRLKNCSSIFGVTGSSSQMMVGGIILGQISFRFSVSLSLLNGKNILVVKKPFLKYPEAFWYIFILIVISKQLFLKNRILSARKKIYSLDEFHQSSKQQTSMVVSVTITVSSIIITLLNIEHISVQGRPRILNHDSYP